MEQSLPLVDDEVKVKYQEYLENPDDFTITSRLKEDLSKMTIPKDLQNLLNYLPSRSVWAIGGDGWAYDIGFGGIDHILSSNEKIKILVLDTEVYSNTGGQMSKSSTIGQVAEFADFGKKTAKKDLFKIAMCYPNCYVGAISLGANFIQAIKVLTEAENHDGPSIVIAYAPCVEHGIKNGLSCTTSEQKLAVECGYQLLMHYNPQEEKLYFDSAKPDFSKYSEFLDNETRFHALKIKDASLAKTLLDLNKEAAMQRYEYYQKLINN